MSNVLNKVKKDREDFDQWGLICAADPSVVVRGSNENGKNDTTIHSGDAVKNQRYYAVRTTASMSV